MEKLVIGMLNKLGLGKFSMYPGDTSYAMRIAEFTSAIVEPMSETNMTARRTFSVNGYVLAVEIDPEKRIVENIYFVSE